jgi:hypothetical protein
MRHTHFIGVYRRSRSSTEQSRMTIDCFALSARADACHQFARPIDRARETEAILPHHYLRSSAPRADLHQAAHQRSRRGDGRQARASRGEPDQSSRKRIRGCATRDDFGAACPGCGKAGRAIFLRGHKSIPNARAAQTGSARYRSLEDPSFHQTPVHSIASGFPCRCRAR